MVDGYIVGALELIVKIAASYDLHDKLNAYHRNGVKAYVVWRTEDATIDWFVLMDGAYNRHAVSDDGIYRSLIFPGRRLDSAAILQNNMARVLQVLQQGFANVSHQEFVARISKKR